MDNIQSVHKGLHLYLVILFLLFVSRILAFNSMLMSVKIRRYCAIIISSSSKFRSLKVLLKDRAFWSVYSRVSHTVRTRHQETDLQEAAA